MSRERISLSWDPSFCRHCFGCIAICPQGALGVDDRGGLSYDPRRCIRCFRCVKACLNGALQAVRIPEE